MTSRRVPLGILDLVPVSAGSTAAEAVENALDLARTAERLGYHRYWFAEHHLNPGVAGSSPPLLIAMAAAVTQHIRLGSGGVQSGHRTALSVVEEFGLLDALHPGRIDLGIGRSGGRTFFQDRLEAASAKAAPATTASAKTAPAKTAPAKTAPAKTAPEKNGARRRREPRRTQSGVLIPAPPSLRALAGAPRIRLTAELLQQERAESAEYGQLIEDILGLLRGSYRSSEGLDPHPVPGSGADVEPWILGSSAGESAEVAGRLGIRFAASYHISPATALEAAEAYRKAFVPSRELDRPHVAISADVVVGPDDASAQRLAAGYGLWVRSIRKGEGAMPFPDHDEAARHTWSDDDRTLVRDRVETQFVGSPVTVARRLRALQEEAEADEVIVTTITHNHADRVRSFSLLAQEWFSDDSGSGRPTDREAQGG